MAHGGGFTARHMLWMAGHRLQVELSVLVLSPWVWGAFAAILVIEVVWPAQRSQRLLSRGRRHDLVWLGASLVSSLISVGVAAALQAAARAAPGPVPVDVSGLAPPAVLGVAAFVLGDLLAWAEHMAQHKFAVLWRFHAVHHSQRELNAFTATRHHLVEYALSPVITFLPFILLGLDHRAPIAALVVARDWHARLVHANVRSDFGPLRHVFVTPQSHRIHHSTEPRHYDRNLGAMLSVWDRLFGTSWDGHLEYPDTGLLDAAGLDVDRHRGALRSFAWNTAAPFLPARRTAAAMAR